MGLFFLVVGWFLSAELVLSPKKSRNKVAGRLAEERQLRLTKWGFFFLIVGWFLSEEFVLSPKKSRNKVAGRLAEERQLRLTKWGFFFGCWLVLI